MKKTVEMPTKKTRRFLPNICTFRQGEERPEKQEEDCRVRPDIYFALWMVRFLCGRGDPILLLD